MTDRNKNARQKHLWEDKQEQPYTGNLRAPYKAYEEHVRCATCQAEESC